MSGTPPTKEVPCDVLYCTKTFSSQKTMKTHVEETHKVGKQCPLGCKYTVNRRQYLVEHFKQTHGMENEEAHHLGRYVENHTPNLPHTSFRSRGLQTSNEPHRIAELPIAQYITQDLSRARSPASMMVLESQSVAMDTFGQCAGHPQGQTMGWSDGQMMSNNIEFECFYGTTDDPPIASGNVMQPETCAYPYSSMMPQELYMWDQYGGFNAGAQPPSFAQQRQNGSHSDQKNSLGTNT